MRAIEEVTKDMSLINEIRKIQKAEKRIKARWIDLPLRGISYRCSNCGMCLNDDRKCFMNFCPNCGADMREAGGERWIIVTEKKCLPIA